MCCGDIKLVHIDSRLCCNSGDNRWVVRPVAYRGDTNTEKLHPVTVSFCFMVSTKTECCRCVSTVQATSIGPAVSASSDGEGHPHDRRCSRGQRKFIEWKTERLFVFINSHRRTLADTDQKVFRSSIEQLTLLWETCALLLFTAMVRRVRRSNLFRNNESGIRSDEMCQLGGNRSEDGAGFLCNTAKRRIFRSVVDLLRRSTRTVYRFNNTQQNQYANLIVSFWFLNMSRLSNYQIFFISSYINIDVQSLDDVRMTWSIFHNSLGIILSSF